LNNFIYLFNNLKNDSLNIIVVINTKTGMIRIDSGNSVSRVVLDETNLPQIKRTGLFDNVIKSIEDLDNFINTIERADEITVLSKVGMTNGFIHRCSSKDDIFLCKLSNDLFNFTLVSNLLILFITVLFINGNISLL